MIVAAHDEEPVIERRVANLRELDYPSDRLELVVTSDASTDRTEELAEAAGARVIRNPRGGKVAAQDSAVRQTESDVVAFSDANCTWAPDALRKLVRSFADPDVAYVCGRLNLESDDGRNKEGLYWRYELALRADESRIDSVTGGNGSIYAVRREDYLEVDPRFGHDLSFPYRMVQRGRRAVYEPEANAYEKATPTNEDEYRRKVRMFEHCWAIVFEGKMLRRLRPVLPRRGRLAPASPLRQRAAARRAARVDDRAARRRRCTRSRSGCSSGCSRRPRSASASRATTSS